MQRLFASVIKTHLSFLIICIFFSESFANKTQEPEQPSCRDILIWNTDLGRRQIIHRQEFINNTLAAFEISITFDSLTTSQLQIPSDSIFYLTLKNLGPVPYLGTDPLANELRRKNGDVPPMFNLNHFVGGIMTAVDEWKKQNRNSWPIPDNTEIAVLNLLWHHQAATGSEIYGHLDSLYYLSAEDLQAKLAKMVSRGFIDRDQISPAQAFKLSGIFKIELNAKNRRNRVYLYWPLVDMEKLIGYLESQRNRDGEMSSSDPSLAELEKRLEKSLYQLVQSRRY